MLNLASEWMRLLLLRTFYQPEIHSSTFTQQTQPTSPTSPSSPTSSFPRFAIPVGRKAEPIRKLFELGKDECPKSATRVLELIKAYDRLFTLRFAPMTVVQMAYISGKTMMRTVVAGASTRPGVGSKTITAGRKARDQVRECIGYLRSIGLTWPSGNVTADLLEKELEGEIQNQAMMEMQTNGERAPKRKSTSPLPNPTISRPKYRPMTLNERGEPLTGLSSG